MSKTPWSSGSKADLAKGLSLAFEFAGSVFIFWFLGRLADDWLGTEPWLQVTGAVLGWAGGVAHVYYASLRMSGGSRPPTKKQDP